MNRGQFRSWLLEFLENRTDLTTAVLNSFINMAQLRIQRDFDLAFAQSSTNYVYPSTAGVGVVLPASFKSFPSDHSCTIVLGTARTPLVATKWDVLQRNGWTQPTVPHYYIRQLGDVITLYTYPEQLGSTIEVFSFDWLDAYTDDGDEDFLLLRGYDAMLWETLKIANMHLKEEEKVVINNQLSAAALNALNQYCRRLNFAGGSIEV